MNIHRPTVDEMPSTGERPFGANVTALRPSDPIDPTPMKRTLDELREYDRNPRREHNPKYKEIKASIRAKKGLDNPLTITRRPNERDKPFMVHAGGNTRLRILNELYEETRDPDFFEVDSLFIPWQSDTDEIIAHLIENDVRGDLVFIDRAVAMRELRMEIEQALGEKLTQNRFASVLREKGYRAGGQPMISKMEYAVETLLPCLPLALRAGLGKLQIDRIRKFDAAITTYLEYLEKPGRIGEARQIFLDALARYDHEEWDLEPTRRDTQNRLAEWIGVDSDTLAMDFEAILKGWPPGPREAPPSEPLPEGPARPRKKRGPAPNPGSGPEARLAGTGNVDEETAGGSPEAVPANRVSLAAVESSPHSHPPSPLDDGAPQHLIPGASDQATDSCADEAGVASPSLKDLRTRMWTAATQLVGRNGLDECVVYIRNAGGYVIDLPSQTLLADNPDTDQIVKRIALWWFLGSMVDEWSMLEDAEAIEGVLRMVPQDTSIYPLLCGYLDKHDPEKRRQTTLSLKTWVSMPTHVPLPLSGHWLFGVLDDTEFKAVVTLIDTRRTLIRMCKEQDKRYVCELV